MPAFSICRLSIVLVIPVSCTVVAAMAAGQAQLGSGKSAPPGPGDDVPAQPTFVEREESPPAFKELTARLTKLLKADSLEAEVSLHGDELVVRYRTRKFMVHGQYKTGEFTEKALEEEGPRIRGFRLHAYFHTERPRGALVVPCDIQEPYWTTFANQYAIGTGKDSGYISVRLSYTHQTDSKLLERLKSCLAVDENRTPGRASNSGNR